MTALVTIFLGAICLAIWGQYPALLSSQFYSEAQQPQQNLSSVLPKTENETGIDKWNHAQSSEGDFIILEKSSPHYKERRAVFWSQTCPSPFTWKPGVFPGNCWAFEGNQGHMVIRLIALVKLTHITLQHPSPTMTHTRGTTHTRRTTSAPRELEIFGLQANNTEVFLGKFIFDVQKSEVETFHLQNDPPSAFSKVKIQVLSNWGNRYITILHKIYLYGVQFPELADDNAMEVTGEPH
ncbi:sperm-associated antigen 4 protein-like isoform X1 [Mastomys coucha]|uniref:sperm-associated antigen 4 protein-like isoform X1 n=1 Tax=Mastomys coucha TaxID=35658 RepID=UPI0012619F31|nr:sperm-associated antigen 4 protein-like isoform X1 [Mastomys coucha]XP_031206782.1 sperm-associated antigen 4 protein-like isoform X1 [Mastomys coucha]